MERNMDLIREILLKMEAWPHGRAPDDLQFEGYDNEQIAFHVLLAGQAGLIEVEENSILESGSPEAIPLYLTWDGYEFLAASKNSTVYNRSKTEVLSKAGAMSFELLKALLISELRRHLGLP